MSENEDERPGKLTSALSLLREMTRELRVTTDDGPTIRWLRFLINAFESVDPNDEDLAWATALVVASVGLSPGFDGKRYDIAEVEERVRAALALQKAKATKFYRTGTTWTKYIVVGLASGDVNRVMLLPEPPVGSFYRKVNDPIDDCYALGESRVPWPPFEPPEVRLLVSEVAAERAASGFVSESLAVAGQSSRPDDVTYKKGS